MVDKLKKSPDENLLQYQLRIYRNKDAYNLTFEEMADLFNKETGENWGESKYRKFLSAFNKGYEFAIQNNLDTTEAKQELEEAQKDFEIAKQQFQDQRREYRKYLRHEGRLDHLLRELLDSIKDDLENKKPLEWYQKKHTVSTGKAGALLLSDIHKGLKTDNYWNKYDDDIFYERLEQVINETIEYKSVHNLDELHVFSNGDLIHGVLHRLTRIGDTEDAVRATQSVAEAFAEMLSVLANEFPLVKFYSVKGNHDRAASRKEEEIRTESFHDFVPWYMKARLKNFDNIEFIENEIDDEIVVAEIKGNTYFSVHGHLDNLGQVIQNLSLMIKKIPVAVFSSHIHKNFENEIHGIDLIVNGGFAGTDDYAKDKRLTSKAHQKFLILDEKGRKTTEYIRF